MKQLLETLDLALVALEESVDLVREDYENAKKLYSNYPSRQARLIGLEDGLSKHEAAITAIKQARSSPVQEPYKGLSEHMMQATNGRVRIDPVTGNAGIGNPPAAPVQEPVAWGIIASNTGRICQVELDSAEVEGHNPKHIVPLYTTPPAANRPWFGLTDEEIDQGLCRTPYAMKTAEAWREGVRWAYHQLKDKNT